SPEVRCHYFLYPQRREDRVLEALVRKVEIVQQELGSLGAVLLEDIAKTLEPGIHEATHAQLELVGRDANTQAVDRELASQRKEQSKLEAEVARAGRRLEASKKALQVHPESLRGVVDVGLRLAGASGLIEIERGSREASPPASGRGRGREDRRPPEQASAIPPLAPPASGRGTEHR